MEITIDLSNWHILLVEQTFHAAKLIKTMLEYHNANVCWMGSTLTGLMASQDTPRPNVILCNAAIPPMGAVYFINELLRLPGMVDLPMIAITNQLKAEDERYILAAGFNGYILKPFANQTFVYDIFRIVRSVRTKRIPD